MAVDPKMEYFKEFRDLYCDGSAEEFLIAALIDAGYMDRMDYCPCNPEFADNLIRKGCEVEGFYFKYIWELHNEIWENISTHVGDKPFLKRYICSMILACKELSAYFYPGEDASENQKEISEYLLALKDYKLPRKKELDQIAAPIVAELKSAPDAEIISIEERQRRFSPLMEIAIEQYNQHLKLNIYRVTWLIAHMMEELAVHITACLLESGEKSTIFDYQRMCGVLLTDAIYPFNLCRTMDWTMQYAESYLPEPMFYYPDSLKAKINTKLVANAERTDKSVEKSSECDSIIQCYKFICSKDILDLLDVVCLALDVQPKRFRGNLSKEDYAGFIDTHIKARESYVYPNMAALEAKLASEIKSRKDDEIELTNYIVSFLSPFYEISISLFPMGNKMVDVKRRVIFSSASAFITCPFKDYLPILSDAISSVVSHNKDGEDITYVDLMNAMLDRAQTEGTVPEDRVFASIHSIKTTLLYVEAALESALLKSGITHDYIYYEEEAGVYLGRQVSDFELMKVSRLTAHTIALRIKKYGHSTRTGIRDGEDTYDYINRLFGCNPYLDNDGSKFVVVYAPQSSSTTQSAGESSGKTGNTKPVFPPDSAGTIVLSDTMKSYLIKANSYFKDCRWHNDDILEYAIFLKAFFKVLFSKGAKFNTYWRRLPILPLSNGTVPTSLDFINAMRRYDERVNGGTFSMFERMLKS